MVIVVRVLWTLDAGVQACPWDRNGCDFAAGKIFRSLRRLGDGERRNLFLTALSQGPGWPGLSFLQFVFEL